MNVPAAVARNTAHPPLWLRIEWGHGWLPRLSLSANGATYADLPLTLRERLRLIAPYRRIRRTARLTACTAAYDLLDRHPALIANVQRTAKDSE